MTNDETLISAAWLITPTATGVRTIPDGAVLLHGDRIAAVGSRAELVTQAAPDQHLALPHHLLAPGLINAHAHSAMALLRGAADDLPLERWLRERIWPMEAELLDEHFVGVGTRLAAAEMLLGGTTTCADMYFHTAAGAQAYLEMGLRAMLAPGILDFPTRYAPDADGYVALALAARDQFAGEPTLSFCLAPHAPYTVGDATFTRVVAFADELGIPIHTHLQETAQEVADSVTQFGERPAARLARLGVLGPSFFAAHGVTLNAEDIALLGKYGASVVHCPSSNLKLASGIAPITDMLRAGVNVALGTDGAASNNRLDLFEEMRLAALLAKVQACDASALNARTAFTLATLNGARALGLSDVTGSLEPGKSADVIALSLDSPGLTPLFDPVSHFVYAASRTDVTHVWVNGRARVVDAQLVDDAARVLAELAPQINALSARVAALRH
ncbi:MAG: TRZ/ATZ family hydrolase [Burkholderiales bacterium]|nr:TRZ/ATZ family hydrolase [Burkholderiales bacterium]